MPVEIKNATQACVVEMRQTTGHYLYDLDRSTTDYIEALAEQVILGKQLAVAPISHDIINVRSVVKAISGITATKPDLLGFGDMHPNALARDFVSQCVPLLKRLGIKTFLIELTSSQVQRIKSATTPEEFADAVSHLPGGGDRTSYAHLIRTLESNGITAIGVNTEPGYVRRIKGQEREDLLFETMKLILEQHSQGEVACLFGRDHLRKEPLIPTTVGDESFFERSFTSMLEQSGRSISAIHITGGFCPPESIDNLPQERSSGGFYGYEYVLGYGIHTPEYISDREGGIWRAHNEWFHGEDWQTASRNAFVHAVNAVLDNEPGAMSYLANLTATYGSPGFAAIFYNAARQVSDHNAQLAFERNWSCASPLVQAVMTEHDMVQDRPRLMIA